MIPSPTRRDKPKPVAPRTEAATTERPEETRLRAAALQAAILKSVGFVSIATDENGVIQIFNAGAERMFGYQAAEVQNRITPADISDPLEVIARAAALSRELGAEISPGFDALVFKARREIEDIYELTCVRKDGTPVPGLGLGDGAARRGRRNHRLPADREGYHASQAGRGGKGEDRTSGCETCSSTRAPSSNPTPTR